MCGSYFFREDKIMALQYFYGSQSEQFSFYRIPKVLFTDEKYRGISMEAKVLYGLMLDRMSLSRENGWTDDQDRVYIIFSIEKIMAALGCGNKKVSIYLNELEEGCGLIERKRRGFGLPNIIYVKNFINDSPAQTPVAEPMPEPEEEDSGRVEADTSRNVHPDTSRNVHVDTSGSVQMTRQEVSNGHANDTELSDTEIELNNNTYPPASIHPFPSLQTPAREAKGSDPRSRQQEEEKTRADYRRKLEENLGYDFMRSWAASTGRDPWKPSPEEQELFDLILDTLCTGKKAVRICGEEKPVQQVRERLLQLRDIHIRYALDCLAENTTEVRNPKQYLLATLYNASMTLANHERNKYQSIGGA